MWSNHLAQSIIRFFYSQLVGAMKPAALAIVAISFLVSACAFTSVSHYTPVKGATAHRGTTCGYVPYVYAIVPFPSGISGSISLSPKDNHVDMSFQLQLEKGVTLEFENASVRLESVPTGPSSEAKLLPFQLSVFERPGKPGHVDYFPPTSLLEGKGRNADLATEKSQYLNQDWFITGAKFEVEGPTRIELHFPPARINGVPYELGPVEFVREREAAYDACVK
jgi:hypothetical protein